LFNPYIYISSFIKGIVKKANIEHEKIKKLAIGPKAKGFSVLDC
jgi:hypothetical protein